MQFLLLLKVNVTCSLPVEISHGWNLDMLPKSVISNVGVILVMNFTAGGYP